MYIVIMFQLISVSTEAEIQPRETIIHIQMTDDIP